MRWGNNHRKCGTSVEMRRQYLVYNEEKCTGVQSVIQVISTMVCQQLFKVLRDKESCWFQLIKMLATKRTSISECIHWPSLM